MLAPSTTRSVCRAEPTLWWLLSVLIIRIEAPCFPMEIPQEDLILGSYKKDPTIWETISGSPVFGDPQ